MKILNQNSLPPEYKTRRFFFCAREKKTWRNGTEIHSLESDYLPHSVRVLYPRVLYLVTKCLQAPTPSAIHQVGKSCCRFGQPANSCLDYPAWLWCSRSCRLCTAIRTCRWWNGCRKHAVVLGEAFGLTHPETGHLNGNSSCFLLVTLYKFQDNHSEYITNNSKHFSNSSFTNHHSTLRS
jgi:hypothetical protein